MTRNTMSPMGMFHSWVQDGNFDKPRDAEDLHRYRLKEQNKDINDTIGNIMNTNTNFIQSPPQQ
jgi:hypothetical protein